MYDYYEDSKHINYIGDDYISKPIDSREIVLSDGYTKVTLKDNQFLLSDGIKVSIPEGSRKYGLDRKQFDAEGKQIEISFIVFGEKEKLLYKKVWNVDKSITTYVYSSSTNEIISSFLNSKYNASKIIHKNNKYPTIPRSLNSSRCSLCACSTLNSMLTSPSLAATLLSR